ncbi:hypothetical protein ACFQH3_02530 [Haladaptatus sp. GCM10025707]|uniref:DUF7289 family protein n=1 Tax=Haladaptatus sp. GCM10025707 TaxID=3252658 RepID=UPI003622CA3F
MGSTKGKPAQADVLGYVLVTAMVVSLVTFLLVTASGGIVSVQRSADTSRAETALGVLDMRASSVSLGDSDLQTVRFGNTGDGSLSENETEGSLKVFHSDLENRSTEIYNGSLGALVYENHGTEIAYQGGGVWRHDPNDKARVVSPPEAHYREATLVMLVVRLTGNGSLSGKNAQLQATRGEPLKRIFPNTNPSKRLANGDP